MHRLAGRFFFYIRTFAMSITVTDALLFYLLLNPNCTLTEMACQDNFLQGLSPCLLG